LRHRDRDGKTKRDRLKKESDRLFLLSEVRKRELRRMAWR